VGRRRQPLPGHRRPDRPALGFDGDFDGADAPDIGATEYLLTTPAYQGEGILGRLNVDAIWRAEDGPILVSGDLVVPAHVTLLVQDGTEVVFDGSASFDPDGDIVAWAWDLGGGVVVEDALATHAWPEEGVHVVTLTVTDDDGAGGAQGV